MTEEKKDAPKVIMLPPVLMLLHMAAGLTLNWAFDGHMAHGWGWIGLILLGAALFITGWAKKLFDKAGTHVPPTMPALAIVQDGPYQYSRNPMYASFILAFIAMALLAGTPLMLMMIFPFFYILDQKVIAPEETYLEEKFGDEYRAYKAKVRRWV